MPAKVAKRSSSGAKASSGSRQPSKKRTEGETLSSPAKKTDTKKKKRSSKDNGTATVVETTFTIPTAGSTGGSPATSRRNSKREKGEKGTKRKSGVTIAEEFLVDFEGTEGPKKKSHRLSGFNFPMDSGEQNNGVVDEELVAEFREFQNRIQRTSTNGGALYSTFPVTVHEVVSDARRATGDSKTHTSSNNNNNNIDSRLTNSSRVKGFNVNVARHSPPLAGIKGYHREGSAGRRATGNGNDDARVAKNNTWSENPQAPLTPSALRRQTKNEEAGETRTAATAVALNKSGHVNTKTNRDPLFPYQGALSRETLRYYEEVLGNESAELSGRLVAGSNSSRVKQDVTSSNIINKRLLSAAGDAKMPNVPGRNYSHFSNIKVNPTVHKLTPWEYKRLNAMRRENDAYRKANSAATAATTTGSASSITPSTADATNAGGRDITPDRTSGDHSTLTNLREQLLVASPLASALELAVFYEERINKLCGYGLQQDYEITLLAYQVYLPLLGPWMEIFNTNKAIKESMLAAAKRNGDSPTLVEEKEEEDAILLLTSQRTGGGTLRDVERRRKLGNVEKFMKESLPPTKLNHLAADNIIFILSFCDLVSLYHFCHVNSRFYILSQHYYIWCVQASAMGLELPETPPLVPRSKFVKHQKSGSLTKPHSILSVASTELPSYTNDRNNSEQPRADDCEDDMEYDYALGKREVREEIVLRNLLKDKTVQVCLDEYKELEERIMKKVEEEKFQNRDIVLLDADGNESASNIHMESSVSLATSATAIHTQAYGGDKVEAEERTRKKKHQSSSQDRKVKTEYKVIKLSNDSDTTTTAGNEEKNRKGKVDEVTLYKELDKKVRSIEKKREQLFKQLQEHEQLVNEQEREMNRLRRLLAGHLDDENYDGSDAATGAFSGGHDYLAIEASDKATTTTNNIISYGHGSNSMPGVESRADHADYGDAASGVQRRDSMGAEGSVNCASVFEEVFLTLADLQHFERRICKLILNGKNLTQYTTTNGVPIGTSSTVANTSTSNSYYYPSNIVNSGIPVVLKRGIEDFSTLELFAATYLSTGGQAGKGSEAAGILRRLESFKRFFPLNDDYFTSKSIITRLSNERSGDGQKGTHVNNRNEKTLLRVCSLVKRVSNMKDSEIVHIVLSD